MADLAEAAIVFDHQPGLVGPVPVFLGGWPHLPDDLEWPRTPRGIPMHFLAQIDLSALPKGASVDGLEIMLPQHPGVGTLFVFGACHDYQIWQSDDPFRVLYHSEPVLDLPPVAPPPGTPPLGQDATVPTFFWMQLERTAVPEATSLAPPFAWFARVPVQPRAFLSANTVNPLALSVDDAVGHDPAATAANRLSAALNKAGLDAVVAPHRSGPDEYVFPWLPHLNVLHQNALTREADTLDAFLRRCLVIPESFPWRWLLLARVTQALWSAVDKDYKGVLKDLWGDMPEKGHQWLVLAAQHDPFAQVPAADATAFRAWMLDLETRAPKVPETFSDGDKHTISKKYTDWEATFTVCNSIMGAVRDAMHQAWHYILAEGDVSDFPEDFVAALQPETATRNTIVQQVHQMFGQGYDVQPGADQSPDEVMLLQFCSDGATGMQWGDMGNLQVMISTEDLKVGRFDRVRTSSESH